MEIAESIHVIHPTENRAGLNKTIKVDPNFSWRLISYIYFTAQNIHRLIFVPSICLH